MILSASFGAARYFYECHCILYPLVSAPVRLGCFKMPTDEWHASTLAWLGVILGPTMPPGSLRVPCRPLMLLLSAAWCAEALQMLQEQCLICIGYAVDGIAPHEPAKDMPL